MKKVHLIVAIVFVALAAVARLIPHPNNFSPVGAMALFGGAVFASKYLKYLIPIAALFLSDLFLNNTILRMWFPNHEGMVFFADYMIWGYASFILAVVIGHFFIKKMSVQNVLLGAVGFTLVFFIVSNFGAWLTYPTYPKTFSGLMACYAAGLPFIKSSLAGNVFYSSILFGGYYLFSQNYTLSKAVA
jgi:hypothetical protein